MISRLQKHAGEKGLGGLFEPFPKPKSADDIPVSDTDVGRIPISEPDLDGKPDKLVGTNWLTDENADSRPSFVQIDLAYMERTIV